MSVLSRFVEWIKHSCRSSAVPTRYILEPAKRLGAVAPMFVVTAEIEISCLDAYATGSAIDTDKALVIVQVQSTRGPQEIVLRVMCGTR
jgi:hypothetical protein